MVDTKLLDSHRDPMVDDSSYGSDDDDSDDDNDIDALSHHSTRTLRNIRDDIKV